VKVATTREDEAMNAKLAAASATVTELPEMAGNRPVPTREVSAWTRVRSGAGMRIESSSAWTARPTRSPHSGDHHGDG